MWGLKVERFLLLFLSHPSARLPLQGQPPVPGLQLPAALRPGLLHLPHHPEGQDPTAPLFK